MLNNISLKDWAQQSGGSLLGEDLSVDSICTDTRLLKPAQTYVALKGASFDGHAFIELALSKGAKAIVVERPYEQVLSVPQLIVSDTIKALGHLASLCRLQFQGEVIALTGSVGKTSTRAMLSHMLVAQPLLSSEKNYNNEIGVPKTWFGLSESHQRVLLEMGARSAGDIYWLGEISKPHISLLLNASSAHTKSFGDIEGVRQAKGEIIEITAEQGVCVLNRDDAAFQSWCHRAGPRKVITFGRHPEADFCLKAYQYTSLGSQFVFAALEREFQVEWSLLGEHMAFNAVAAAATAWSAQVPMDDIINGLRKMQPEPGRMQPIPSSFGGTLIHDAYNANPASYQAAIDVLSCMAEETLLIAGDMTDLGEHSKTSHEQIGNYAKNKVSRVCSVGKDSKYISSIASGLHFMDIDELLIQLPSLVTPQTAVLVKGSRSMAMERVVDVLKRES